MLRTRIAGVALLAALLLPGFAFAQSQTGMSGLPGADDFSLNGADLTDYKSELDGNAG